MMNNINNMTKDEVLMSIQKAISLFQKDVLAKGFFDIQNIEVNSEENQELKERLKSLVLRLKEFKENDNEMYDKIISDVDSLDPFVGRVQELEVIQKWIGVSVTSANVDENARKVAELIKSTPVFDFINRNKKEITSADLRLFGESAQYVQLLWKQVKQEELLGLLIYVNSGKAAQDYVEMESLNLTRDEAKEVFLYSKFKGSFHNLRVKDDAVLFTDKTDNKKVSAAHYLDYGVILNSDKKELHFGFATSNFDTKEQKKQYFEMMSSLKKLTESESSKIYGYTLKPIYITNSIVNENELNENQTEKQKPFLKTFAKELTKEDRNILNKSSLLATLGNLASNDKLKGLDILDIAEVNPFISGSDTLNDYHTFNNIKQMRQNFDEEDAALLLRGYLLNNAEKLVGVLEKVAVQNPNEQMHYIHGQVCQHLQSILNATMYGFAGHVQEKYYLNDEFISKVEKIVQRYENVYTDLFQGQEPAKNIGISSFLDIDVRVSMEKNYNRVQKFVQTMEQGNIDVSNVNSMIHQKDLASKILEMSAIVEEITPLLKEIPEFKEYEVETVREAIMQLYEKAMSKPALQSYKDVLSGSDNYDAPEAINWMKKIKTWEKKEDLQGSALVKKELLSQIFSNIRNPEEIKEIVKAYHFSTVEKINDSVEKKNKKRM